MLSKSRKSISEILEIAAVHETMKKSGYKCRSLEHNLPTRATHFTTSVHTEPIAVQQRMNHGAHNTIFLYVAQDNLLNYQIANT